MPARVDATQWSVVVWCRSCSDWSTLALHEANGHDLAVQHDLCTHPGDESSTLNRWRFHHKKLAETA